MTVRIKPKQVQSVAKPVVVSSAAIEDDPDLIDTLEGMIKDALANGSQVILTPKKIKGHKRTIYAFTAHPAYNEKQKLRFRIMGHCLVPGFGDKL